MGFYKSITEEEEGSFDPLPAGEYLVIVEDSEYKENKKGSGMLLKLKYKVIEGPMKDRTLWENLSLEHSNHDTVVIAQKAFNSLKKALGMTEVENPEDLKNIPLKLDLGMKKNKDTDEWQNTIKKHISASGLPATPPAATPQTAAAPAAGGKKKQPWEQ